MERIMSDRGGGFVFATSSDALLVPLDFMELKISHHPMTCGEEHNPPYFVFATSSGALLVKLPVGVGGVQADCVCIVYPGVCYRGRRWQQRVFLGCPPVSLSYRRRTSPRRGGGCRTRRRRTGTTPWSPRGYRTPVHLSREPIPASRSPPG